MKLLTIVYLGNKWLKNIEIQIKYFMENTKGQNKSSKHTGGVLTTVLSFSQNRKLEIVGPLKSKLMERLADHQ